MVPKLETDTLTRVVDGKTIVDSISLRVHESEVLAIIGPSGADKSSFLRLLNRLDEPMTWAQIPDGAYHGFAASVFSRSLMVNQT